MESQKPEKYRRRDSERLLELKWNKSAEKAIKQEENQQYWKFAEKFKYRGKILLVGINYNAKTKKHTCRIKEISVNN